MDNNKNQNQNHNGKEVPREQTLRNGQKENGARPANKIKKNNIVSEIHPAQPKKISLNTNRPAGTQKKSAPKGQVIKLGDKENKIHPADRPQRENNRTYSKTASENTTVGQSFTTNLADNKDNHPVPEKTKFSISDTTGNWLLAAAVILLIAWGVIFFYYHIGGNSHMLLAFAVICAVISLAGRRKGEKSNQ
jgi:hypothetical protein